MTNKDLSIVIVNWNTSKMLKDCLSSIAKSSIYDKAKVIIIDNNSDDDSRAMVEKLFPALLLINSGSNMGFGRANNLAAGHIEGDYVLFLNPDTLVFNDSIKKMLTFMGERPEIGALGCRMNSPDGAVQELGLQWYPSPVTELISLLFVSSDSMKILQKCIPYQDPFVSGYVKKLYGGCLLVRKTVLDKIGWFDERFFMYGEDVDLCRRINDAGFKLYYLKEAEIIHIGGGASNKTISEFSVLMMCDSISKLIKKYNGVSGYLLYRFAIFVGSNIRLLLLLIMNRLPYLKRYIANYDRASKKYRVMIRWSLNLKQPLIPS